MLGMHPIAAYFGTDPDLSDPSIAAKYVTMLADTKAKGLGLHIMLCKPGSKEPYDVRTTREKDADQKEWEQFRKDQIARGQQPHSKEKHPGGMYVATNNVKRLQKYLKAAYKTIHNAREELTLLTTRDEIATALAPGGDTSAVSPERLSELRSIHSQVADEVAEIEETKPRKNTTRYNRMQALRPLAEMKPLDDHDRARVLSLQKQLEFPHPNLAVSVGPSNVVVVDCDTTAEVQAFQKWAAKMSGDDTWLRTRPTVSSPGVLREGSWRHKDGGHYWFLLPRPDEPEDAEQAPVGDDSVDTRRVLHPTAFTGQVQAPKKMEPIPEKIATRLSIADPDDPEVKFSVFVNGSYVLIPPSVRPEGPYRASGPSHEMPEWLYDYILADGHRRAEEAEARRQWREGRGALPESVAEDIQNWYNQVSWGELLIPFGWNETGTDSCGCPIWQRPGGASYKSATAHQPGCSQHRGSVDPPIHFWTSEPGPEITAKLLSLGISPSAGSGSLSKLQLAAALHFDGDDGQAMRFALGDGYTGLKVSYEITEMYPGLVTVNTVVERANDDDDDEDSDFELLSLPTARPEDEQYLAPAQQQALPQPDPSPQQPPTQQQQQPTPQWNAPEEQYPGSPQPAPMSSDPWGATSYTDGSAGHPATAGEWPAPPGGPSAPGPSPAATQSGIGQPQAPTGQPTSFGQPDPAIDSGGFGQPQIGAPSPAGAFGHPQPDPAPISGGVPHLPPPAVSPFGSPMSDQPQLDRPAVHPEKAGQPMQGSVPGSGYVGQSPQPPGTGPQASSSFGQTGTPPASAFSLFPGVDDYADTTGGGADEDDGNDGPTLGALKEEPYFFKHHNLAQTAPAFQSLDQLMATRDPVKFILKQGRNGMIQDRALTVVAGPSNAGKSAVLLDILCTMAAEKTEEDGKFGVWMNAMTKRRNILYIAGEGIDGIVNRVAAWEHFHQRSVRQHMSFTSEAFLFDSPEPAWQDLAARVIAGSYQVVVFDTMATMMTGLEENSNDDMGKVMSWLHRFVEKTQAAVILVHHTGKSAENLSPRGASALTGAIASQLLVQKREVEDLDRATQERYDRDGITPIRVSVTKQKDSGYADPLDLTLVRVPVPHRPGLSTTDDFDQDYGYQTVLVGDSTGTIPTRTSAPPVVATPTTPKGYVSDTKDLAARIVARVVNVGSGPEAMRQSSELAKSRLQKYVAEQQVRDGLDAIPPTAFGYEFANAITLAINSGAIREDGTMLHPAVDSYMRRDREKTMEVLLTRVNGASADDVKEAQAAENAVAAFTEATAGHADEDTPSPASGSDAPAGGEHPHPEQDAGHAPATEDGAQDDFQQYEDDVELPEEDE